MRRGERPVFAAAMFAAARPRHSVTIWVAMVRGAMVLVPGVIGILTIAAMVQVGPCLYRTSGNAKDRKTSSTASVAIWSGRSFCLVGCLRNERYRGLDHHRRFLRAASLPGPRDGLVHHRARIRDGAVASDPAGRDRLDSVDGSGIFRRYPTGPTGLAIGCDADLAPVNALPVHRHLATSAGHRSVLAQRWSGSEIEAFHGAVTELDGSQYPVSAAQWLNRCAQRDDVGVGKWPRSAGRS